MDIDLAKRYQTLIVLWFALLMSIGMYFLFLMFAAPELSNAPRDPRSSALIVTLTALGTFLVLASFAVKRKFLQRSIEQQDVGLVQKGLMISCAMCEVSALLGMLERLAIGNREYYLLFVIAAAGTAFHFPRRIQLEAASYKHQAKLS